jgi:hypothetical protein
MNATIAPTMLLRAIKLGRCFSSDRVNSYRHAAETQGSFVRCESEE